MDIAEHLEPFHTHAADALVAFDFDGTLAPIVDSPDAAAPLDGVPAALERLAARFGEVAIISGRPLEFLQRWFPEPSGLTLVGLYGLESRRFGEAVSHPNAGVWREVIADVAGLARLQGPEGMDIEPKGLSITLHYRRRPEIHADVVAWAETVAGPAGLRVRPAKMSVELHPPIDEDKGTVLSRLVAAHAGPVLFAGDDLGDCPAFDVIDTLRSDGRSVVAVVVDSDELPAALRSRADLLVEGPAAMADLIHSLTT